jgi:hypothetical protein
VLCAQFRFEISGSRTSWLRARKINAALFPKDINAARTHITELTNRAYVGKRAYNRFGFAHCVRSQNSKGLVLRKYAKLRINNRQQTAK